MKNFFLIIAVFTIIYASSCSSKQKEENKAIDGFPIIIEHFETNGDYINSAAVPFFVNAQEVYQNLKNNWLLIDLRSKDHFLSGHIRNSVNVRPSEIVDYFEKNINPSSFDKIVLICNSGNF